MQITDTASSQIVEPAKVPPKCTEITPKPPVIQLQIPNIWKSTVNCDPSSSSRNELLRLAFAQWPDSSWSFENKYWASFQRQLGGCVWLVRNTLLENIDWGIKERCPISDQNSLRENSCKFETVSVLKAHKHRWPQKDGKIWDSETLSPGLILSLPALPTECVGRLSRNSTILSPPQILTHCKYKYRDSFN